MCLATVQKSLTADYFADHRLQMISKWPINRLRRSIIFRSIDFTDYSLFTQWPPFHVGYLLAFRAQ